MSTDRAPIGKFLSARQIAEMLSCSIATVWRMTRDGRLPQPARFGGLTRWREADVFAAIEAAEGKGKR